MGQTVPCPTCEKPLVLLPDVVIPTAKITVAAALTPSPISKPVEQKRGRSNLPKLTEETIRAATKTGDTPLHRATKNGQFGEIPSHLLSIELFMVKNNAGETPLHVAAKHGHLDQVPRQFLTKETMTIRRGNGSYLTGSGKVAYTDTPLHMAAADQIPKQFLTPEFLSLRASGYQTTLLHCLAYQNRLDLVPQEFSSSEIWNLTDHVGRTARDVIQENVQRDAFVTKVRSEPATEKQKEKLRYFNYDVKAGMTKGEASDAIEECVKKFPEVNRAYYNRPATEEQLAKLREINKSPDVDPEEPYYDPEEPLTYQEAKDAIYFWELDQRKLREEQDEKEMMEDMRQMRIDDALEDVNSYADDYRPVTHEEVAKAWDLVKSRKTDQSKEPATKEILEALEEIFPDFKRRTPDPRIFQCPRCPGKIKVEMPTPTAFSFSVRPIITGSDIIRIVVKCPDCGGDISASSLDM